MRILRSLMTLAAFVAAGWYGGAKFGAPKLLLSGGDAIVERASSAISGIMGSGIKDRDNDTASTDNVSQSSPPENSAPAGNSREDNPAPLTRAPDELFLCNIKVSNAPPADATGRVVNFKPLVQLNGVSILLNPTTKACMSSGFGYRGMSIHRGVDYFSDSGGLVLAAGDGIVREVITREDFGNMVLIDHGAGVFTRYAHLARFDSALREGQTIRRGATLGPIGRTGRAGALHLHYEIRTGEYNSNAGSFGLEPVDPFALPAG